MVHHPSRPRVRALVTASLLAALLALRAPVAAQPPCDLGLTAHQVPVEQLTLADFDLDHFESRGLIFSVDITPTCAAEVTGVQLRIVLMIDLADNREFTPAAVLLTEPFTVPADGRTITNLNLGQSKDIRFASYEIIEAAQDAIEERALATGVFPAGVYTFRFSLEGYDAAPADVEIRIGNPGRVELISPAEGEETSAFPVFEFYHDASAARLTVAELRAGQTYEDAIEREPAMLEEETTTERTLIYSGGRPLEPGKSYVWRVQTLTRVAGGGNVGVSSPVRAFTVSAGGSIDDALLARLEMMYGRLYPDIFLAIREGGFRSTGTYALDGKSLGEPDLMKLLDALQEAIDDSELTFE